MLILGINAYHGDAAAAIVRDGVLVAAAEEERFNRRKHCAGFPTESIKYCLDAAGANIEDVEHIGISRDPSAHLHKKILFAATKAAKSMTGLERTQNLPGPQPGRGIFTAVADRLANTARVRSLKDDLAKALGVSKNNLHSQFHNIEHHRAHLASSFFVSPFERAALLSIDGFGDFISTMWGVGDGNSIEVLGQVEYPHSSGILYTATTQFLGFPHYGDEGKVMGLAPYGRPRYMKEFRDIIRTDEGGRFRLNLDYFRHHTEGVEMSWDEGSPVIGRIYSNEFVERFGPAREQGGALTDRERDIAASLQQRLEEVGFHILNHLHEKTGVSDLGLSGGVAYNSVMNGKILLNTPFRRIFVQPAAGDSGTAVGVCYQIHNEVLHKPRGYVMEGAYTGPEFSDAEIEREFQISNLKFQRSSTGKFQSSPSEFQGSPSEFQISNFKFQRSSTGKFQSSPSKFQGSPGEFQSLSADKFQGSTNEVQSLSKDGFERLSDDEVTKRAAADIADGKVVGWFQGRMEFGPRALGNRSIVVDPRRADMKDILNERIKKREPFRPFAPSILEEHVGDYFEQTHPAPTMLMVYQIRPERRSEIPAVTHVDGSGRLQTVSREVNERYYDLISEFHKLTGVPVVLNTSFNENEPIVCTPRDAIKCFMKTKIDVLYLGNYAIRREN